MWVFMSICVHMFNSEVNFLELVLHLVSIGNWAQVVSLVPKDLLLSHLNNPIIHHFTPPPAHICIYVYIYDDLHLSFILYYWTDTRQKPNFSEFLTHVQSDSKQWLQFPKPAVCLAWEPLTDNNAVVAQDIWQMRREPQDGKHSGWASGVDRNHIVEADHRAIQVLPANSAWTVQQSFSIWSKLESEELPRSGCSMSYTERKKYCFILSSSSMSSGTISWLDCDVR